MSRATAAAAALVVAVVVPTLRGETLTPSAHPSTSIQVASELRPTIDAMLEASPTFREQFERLQTTPGLVLAATVTPTLHTESFRARSSMRRYSSGLVVVVVEIGPTARRPEMIAHEFEHVLEQLEGIDLRTNAEHGRGAWFSSGSMIETVRAVRAGQTVQSEVSGRHGDKSVQAGQ